MPNRFRDVLVTIVLTAGVAVAIACDESSQNPGAPDGAAQPPVAASLVPDGGMRIAFPDRVFTIDDAVEAGWKRSKQFPADSLPGATEVWYGFFNRKDVEIRVYASHASAAADGQAPAYQATQRQKRRGGGERGAGHESITAYNAYLIAGNLVMLCEVEVASCEALLEEME